MAIKGTLAAELEKTARKIKKNNIKKKAENAKTKAASKRTSTENARRSNGKTVKVSGKTSGAGKKTATEKVRHTNSGTVKNTTYTPSLRDNYDSYVRRSHTIRKAEEDFNAYRNANARQSYGQRENVKKERDAALKAKKTASNVETAKKVHGLRGMPVTKEQDAPKALVMGGGAVLSGLISLENAQRDYNAEHPKRKGAAVYKGSTGMSEPSSEKDFLDNYQDFYKKKSEEWAADPASQTLPAKVLTGIGQYGAETLLGGGNPVGASLIRAMEYTGNRYDEAREAGASVEDAQKAAIKYAVPMAIAESIGGPERLVGSLAKGGTSVLKGALKSGASEAAEEALQYPWESYSKTFYGKDVPLYANGKDENGNYIDAVINPSAMKENALVGGTVGALMGGFGGYTSKVNYDNAVAGVDSRELAALKAAADDYRKGMIDGAQLRAASSAVKRQASAERIYIEKAYSNDTQAKIRANEAVRRGILMREEADIALGKRRAEITENTLRDAGVEQETAKRIGNMSERLNVRVLTDETDDNTYGSYDSDSRTIYLNPRSEKPLEYIMAHEITHLMEGTEEYNAFLSAATTFYGDRLSAVRQNIIDAYARRGVELNEGKFNNETAAYFVQDELFRDPGRVSAAVNRMSGNLWQRILQAFDNMIVRLKGTQDEIVLSDIRNQWIAAGRAGGNPQAVTMDGNNDSYSINIRDTDLNGKEERGHAQTAYDDAFNRGEVGMVDAIDSAFLNGDPGVTKNTLTDAEAQATVNDSLAGKDYQQAANDFIRKSNAATKQGLKELVTEGIIIYIEAVNTGDINTAIDMMNANSVLASEIARGLQAYKQLKNLTPTGRLVSAHACMVREATKNTGFNPIEISDYIRSNLAEETENILNDFSENTEIQDTENGDNGGRRNQRARRALDRIRERNEQQDVKEGDVESESVIAERVSRRIENRRRREDREVARDIDDAVRQIDDLVDRYLRNTDIMMPREAAEREPHPFAADIRKALENIESYEASWAEAVSELYRRYANDEDALSIISAVFGDEYHPVINRRMLRSEVLETLDDMGISVNDLATGYYSGKSLTEIVSGRLQGDAELDEYALEQLDNDVRNDIIDEVMRRGHTVTSRFIESQRNKNRPKNTNRTLAQKYGELGAAGIFETSLGRESVRRSLNPERRTRSAVDDAYLAVFVDYYHEQNDMIKNQLLQRYEGNDEAIASINETFDTLSAETAGMRVVRRIVSEAIRNNDIDTKQAFLDGELDGLTSEIISYVDRLSGGRFGGNELAILTGAISEELNQRAIRYRENILNGYRKRFESSNEKESKNGRKLIDEIIRFNKLGAFDDPELAKSILTYIGIPMLTTEDANEIIFIHSLADHVAGKKTNLTDDEIDKGIRSYIGDDVLEKRGPEYSEKALRRMADDIVAKKVKSTGWQKARQLQITSLLFNLKTMNRNVTPNIALAPINYVGDIGASLVDRVLSKTTGQRTKGTVGVKKQLSSMKNGAAEALTDYMLGIDTSTENRAELSNRRHFSNDTIRGRAINSASDLVALSLQIGDRPFENAYRDSSIEAQMKLNNVDTPTDLMRQFAEIEAMERTFKDDNGMTEAFQKVTNLLNRGNAFGFGSALIPFVRTPMNLTRMVYYYTPITGTIQLARNYYNYKTAPMGEAKIVAQHKLVNDASKLIGGSILTAIVMALKAAGLIEIYGGEDKDNRDRQRYEQQVHGFQPYSILIGDYYYNYGNLQPVGSMIAFAVDGYDSMRDAISNKELDYGLGLKILKGLIDTTARSFDQVYDQSLVRGISNLFRYAGDGADIFASIIDVAMSAPNQFIPAFVQQLARVIDPYKRNTNGNPISSIVNNIPGLSRLLPEQVDAYGNPIERYDGGVASDIFNSFINPITTTKRKDNDVASEIERLEELTGETLIPGTVKKSIEYGDENVPLSNKEQSELKKKIGSDIYASIEELIASDEYQKLSPDMKAKAVKNIRDSITDVYKAEFLNSKGKSKTLEGKSKAMAEAPEHGMSVAQYALYDTILSTKDSKEARAYKDSEGNEYTLSASSAKRLFIFNSGLSGEAMRYLMETEGLMGSKDQKTYMKNAEAEGISNIDYMLAYTVAKVYEDIYEHDDAARLNATSDFIDSMTNYNDDQKQTIYEGVYNKWAYHVDQNAERMDFTSDDRAVSARSDTFNAVWNGTSKYLNYAASDLGWKDTDMISAYEWVNNNRSGDKKADFEAAVNKLDISAKQKAALVAARGYKPGSYKDGGSVSMDTVLKENPATGATFEDVTSMFGNIKMPGSYNLATDEEKSRRDSRKALDNWSGNTGVIFPVGTENYSFTGAFGEDRKTHIHQGIDISTNRASGIAALSVMDGEVVYMNTKGGYGNTVIIKNNDGYYCLYGHLDSYASNLKPGDRVKAGQQIGVVGSTGNSTGKHLHFEVRRESENGPAVDPNTVYDIDGDGVLSGGGNQKMGTGSSDPNYTASSYSGGSSSSGSSGSSSGSSSGTIARSVARRRRRIGSGSSYGYSGYSGYTGY